MIIRKLTNTTPYIKVNLVLGVILFCVLLYSVIFSAQGINHPIPSFASADAASVGLSRAFSEIVRGNFEQALSYNPFSIKIFLFFAIQFIFRIAAVTLLALTKIRESQILFCDISLSIIIFIFSFYHFVLSQIQNSL